VQFPKLLSHLFYIIFLLAVPQNKQIITSQLALQPARACVVMQACSGVEVAVGCVCELRMLFSRKTRRMKGAW
jgi:hypothetical protein